MVAVLLQFLAGLILFAGIWLVYRRLTRPIGALNAQQRGAVLLTCLALVGGFVGAWFWWIDEPRSFAWDLPPLASRMLASAGWSFFVLCLLALRRPTRRRMRLVMLDLFVYLAPLVAVILLFHLDRFDFSKPITYTFFGIAGVMTITSAWYLFRPVTIVKDTLRDWQPTPAVMRAWLWVVGIVTGLWGLALFITDQGPSSLIWVWPGDLLSSRLIGVMLLTISAGAIYSRRFADAARIKLLMIMMYSIGLAAASVWNLLSGKPVKPLYIIIFGVIFLVSGGLMVFNRMSLPEVAGKPTGAA